MIKLIKEILKSLSEQRKQQARLKALIGKQKKKDYMIIRIPRKYAEMLEILALYGISDKFQLKKILSKKTEIMEWIDKNNRMPDEHPEWEGCSKDVMVTDGRDWGHGRYYNDPARWVYTLNGQYECDSNDITHWAEPPILPNERKY